MYFLQAILGEVYGLVLNWIRRHPTAGIGIALCGLLLAGRLLMLCLAFLFAGSQGVVTDVAGLVKLKGKPVTEGTVQFLPKSHGQPTSAVISNGQFKAKRVPVGPCRVICVAITETGKMLNEGGHVFPERISLIPDSYREGVDVTIQQRHGELVLDW